MLTGTLMSSGALVTARKALCCPLTPGRAFLRDLVRLASVLQAASKNTPPQAQILGRWDKCD